MKAVLITLLLVVATVSQPLLAAPAACRTPAHEKAVACASCCGANSCCAVSERKDSAPETAEATLPANLLMALPSPAIVLLAPIDLFDGFRSFRCSPHGTHALPPLALSCIQLI